jgi:hypothetical protein
MTPVGNPVGEHPIEVDQLSFLFGDRSSLVEKSIGQEADTPLSHVRHEPLVFRDSLDAILHESLRCDPRCRFGQLIVRPNRVSDRAGSSLLVARLAALPDRHLDGL